MTAHHHHDEIPPGAVVVGYDRTAVAGYALDWAADHAAKEGRPLVVVHAAGSLGTVGTTWLEQADRATAPALVEIDREGQALLAAASARVGERQPSVRVVPVVAMEDVTSELGRLSRTAHLLVTGSRGHGFSRSVPTGQVGTWLARRTSCPLVVVPDYNLGTVRQGVLAGVRWGTDAALVLEFAYRYASTHDLPLTIAHATGRVDSAEKDELRRELAEVVSGYGERYPDVWAHTVLLPGRPAGRLLELADRMNLLVVGQHHGTGLHESPFGHVRSSVVDRSPCPTAIVPVPVATPA
jgi:nucleotide-binding universal stress UspA family protein